MLFRQLEYFVAVALERHFGRAAKRCHVSQPALSAAIAKLERELDVTLIERKTNFVALTAEGERLLPWAKRVIAEHAALKAEMRGMRSGMTGTLRLGTIPTASTTSSLVLSGFCSEHPMVRVQVRSQLATSELYRRLHDFELDAAIVPASPDPIEGLDFVDLYEDRYVLIAPVDMVAPDTSALPWAEAANLPMTLLTPEMRVRQIVDATFANLGITLRPRVETDSVSTLLAQAASGDRACIVPHTWLWTTLMSADLRAIELTDPILTTPITVATNTGARSSPLVAGFVQSAQSLGLEQFFADRLGGIYRR